MGSRTDSRVGWQIIIIGWPRLERLVAEKGLSDVDTLARCRAAWDHAADRTPHGQPIELRPADFPRA